MMSVLKGKNMDKQTFHNTTLEEEQEYFERSVE